MTKEGDRPAQKDDQKKDKPKRGAPKPVGDRFKRRGFEVKK